MMNIENTFAKEETAKVSFSRAKELIASGNNRAAYKLLKEGLAVDPKNFSGHIQLAKLAYKLGRRSEASDQYYIILQHYGFFREREDGLMNFVPYQEVVSSKQYSEDMTHMLIRYALHQFNTALRKHSVPLLEQSLVFINQIMMYCPNYSWMDSQRAWCEIELLHFDQAEAILTKWINLRPDLSAAYVTLAILRFKQRNFLAAFYYLLKGVSLSIRFGKENQDAHNQYECFFSSIPNNYNV